MPRITIDGHAMEVDAGSTVLAAAERAGARIPTLCQLNGYGHFTSCMVCVVKEKISGRLIPACSAPVADGMVIETKTGEVRAARTASLELLLSEHVGDCEAPCRRVCPARINIPLMIRLIRERRFGDARAAIEHCIAPPAGPDRICSAPCEKVCRRGLHDSPVSICLLARFAANVDLETSRFGSPKTMVGCSGGCPHPPYVTPDEDPEEIGAGIRRYNSSTNFGHLQTGKKATTASVENNIRKRFDSRVGKLLGGEMEEFLKEASRHARVEPSVSCSDACPHASPPDGDPEEIGAGIRRYNSATNLGHDSTEQSDRAFTQSEAISEASRCLHCDCRKSDSCRLREYADEYAASQKEYIGDSRRRIEKLGFEQTTSGTDSQTVVYEPGKCIKCGICVRITEKAKERLGLTFLGRGFDARVGVPFGEPLNAGMEKCAPECVESCPTGALAWK